MLFGDKPRLPEFVQDITGLSIETINGLGRA
jgi:hypothetical protein